MAHTGFPEQSFLYTKGRVIGLPNNLVCTEQTKKQTNKDKKKKMVHRRAKMSLQEKPGVEADEPGAGKSIKRARKKVKRNKTGEKIQ